MTRHLKYNELIYSCYIGGEKGIELARKYNVSESYISQIRSKLKQLIHKPKIQDGKIICYRCENEGELVFHYNHNTGQQISLVCSRCNLKTMNNELEYSNKGVNNSISEKLEKIKEGYLQFKILFEDLVKDVSPDNLKKLLRNFNIKLIKEIDSELIN